MNNTLSKCSFPGCGMTFQDENELREHTLIHIEQKPFKCSFYGCKESFMEKNQLIIHFYTHQAMLPFKCTFPGCNKSYSRLSHLRSHEASHLNQELLEVNSKTNAKQIAKICDICKNNEFKKDLIRCYNCCIWYHKNCMKGFSFEKKMDTLSDSKKTSDMFVLLFLFLNNIFSS